MTELRTASVHWIYMLTMIVAYTSILFGIQTGELLYTILGCVGLLFVASREWWSE